MSPTIDEFAEVMELSSTEKKRLASLLDDLNTGRVHGLPSFILNSAGEGLSTLADQLIKSSFLQTEK